MVPGFDVESLNALGKLIGGLERYNLEAAAPEEFDLDDLFEGSEQVFFCIQGLSDFWTRNTSIDFTQHMVDLVVGAHNQHQADLTMVLLGTPRKLSIYLSLGSEKTTRTILEGIFPGILLDIVPIRELVSLLRPHFLAEGVITGIPSLKSAGGRTGSEAGGGQGQSQGGSPTAGAAGKQDQSQLERVIRGMHGVSWAYIVQAHPRPRHKVVEERMKTIDMISQVTTRSRVQWSSTRNDNQQVTTVESGGTTQTYSGDMVNYRAQYLIRLLERELERLDQAAAAGQWLVHVYFGAGHQNDAQRLASLLLGTLSGADSRPEPLRASLCKPQGLPLEAFHTFLTSHEVSTLVQLPREEVPGYAIHDYVRFDVDFRVPNTAALPLGLIQQNGRDTLSTFDISLPALAKHVVVIGVTGSGKTTTVMNLLDRVVDAKIPFLVIEPAKTEYRSLHSAFGDRAKLRVYTLGNEMVAPFRLNPFEFETTDEPGDASLLTHIDFLKAVFNAAFPLYAPMPQVLEEALHEVYEDKGWDLTSGTNRRITDWKARNDYPIFPMLTDLYYKVEVVTNRLGYDKEIESNVKASLKARIGSLRIGSKGMMLDTARGIPMEELLAMPTIMELEGIGNDDEKTFVMGLFLAKLYEYRRLKAATNAEAKGLSGHGLVHLMVIEEAHRLLQNTSTQVDSEGSNMRAQAVEVFTNMLSEMRAYGQGVLVAEQIPSKLAPDVLKNTNLKIVHRLIAKDDRESIGQTMNLNEEQSTHLGILTPGLAAVYAEGADHAYLVRMENYKRNISGLIDADLRRMSRSYASVKPFQSIPDIATYGIPQSLFEGPDPATYHAAGKLLDSEKSKWIWSSVLLRLASDPSNMYEVLRRFSEQIEADMPHLSPEQHDTVLRMVLVRGIAELMQDRGARYGWTYNQVETLRVSLTHGLVGMVQAGQMAERAENPSEEELAVKFGEAMENAGNFLVDFMGQYQNLTRRRQGPFVGCTYCPVKCRYRHEVKALLTVQDRQLIGDRLRDPAYDTPEERYNDVAKAATFVVKNWISEDLTQAYSTTIGFCATLHTLVADEFSEYDQFRASEPLRKALLEGEEETPTATEDEENEEDDEDEDE